MTRRDRDVILLCGSLLDAPLAQPKTWTGELVRRSAKRGETPSTWVRCPVCHGECEVRQRGFMVPCQWCLGEKGKPLGKIMVDANLNPEFRRRMGSQKTGIVVVTRTVHCDVCGATGVTLAPRWRGENNRCLRCNGGGRIELTLQQWQATRTPANGHELDAPLRSGDAVLDCMEARTRAGSYDELVLALHELNEAWPSLYRLTRDVYVLGQDVGTVLQRLALEGGIAFLAARMPEQIRVPGSVRKRVEAAA